MLLSGTWLHFIVGTFVIGGSAFFIVSTVKLLKQDKVFYKLVGSLLLFTLWITVIIFIYTSAFFGGITQEWNLLGLPNSFEPANKIVDVGYVQGVSGNLYHFTCLGCTDGKWEMVNEVIKDEYYIFTFPSDECIETLSFLPVHRNNFKDFKMACVSSGLASQKVAYAIDREGQVYSWSNGSGELSEYYEIFFSIIGGVTSCIFGILTILLMIILRFTKSILKKKFSIIPNAESFK